VGGAPKALTVADPLRAQRPPERASGFEFQIETKACAFASVKGNIIVAGRRSPKSLYDPRIATMEGTASAYDQGDATGFIRLNALRLKVRAAMKSSPGVTKD
jgi:argininosuccinate synthase